MAGNIPDWAAGFGLGLAAGKADVAQDRVVQIGKAVTLATDGEGKAQAGHEAPAMPGGATGGAVGQRVHGMTFLFRDVTRVLNQ